MIPVVYKWKLLKCLQSTNRSFRRHLVVIWRESTAWT